MTSISHAPCDSLIPYPLFYLSVSLELVTFETLDKTIQVIIQSQMLYVTKHWQNVKIPFSTFLRWQKVNLNQVFFKTKLISPFRIWSITRPLRQFLRLKEVNYIKKLKPDDLKKMSVSIEKFQWHFLRFSMKANLCIFFVFPVPFIALLFTSRCCPHNA